MKKITLLLIISLFIIKAEAQTGQIKDTSKVKEVYVFDHVDTVQVATVIYKGENNTVKWSSPGYQLYQGKVKQEGKGLAWIADPKLIGLLDDKKRVVKPL